MFLVLLWSTILMIRKVSNGECSKTPYPVFTNFINYQYFIIVFVFATFIDGIVNYKLGLVIALVILVMILFLLIKRSSEFFRKERFKVRRGYIIFIALFLLLLNLSIYIFNVFIWIDLLDGKTNALLP